MSQFLVCFMTFNSFPGLLTGSAPVIQQIIFFTAVLESPLNVSLRPFSSIHRHSEVEWRVHFPDSFRCLSSFFSPFYFGKEVFWKLFFLWRSAEGQGRLGLPWSAAPVKPFGFTFSSGVRAVWWKKGFCFSFFSLRSCPLSFFRMYFKSRTLADDS